MSANKRFVRNPASPSHNGARFSRTGSLDGFAVEALPAGAIVPSAVETNLVNLAAVRTAMEGIRERLTNLRFITSRRGRDGHAPMRGHRLARPERA